MTRLRPWLTHVVSISLLAIAAIAAAVLAGFDGWHYYRLPLDERSFAAANRWLRPSAPIGHLLGIIGLLLMLVPVVYAIRKKVRALRDLGSMQTWLNVHIFAGIVGPACVTLHTSFKFNGIVSVAYWSMVAVVLSGFVGRYLYAQIPRSLRGQELTKSELDKRALVLSDRLAAAQLTPIALARISEFERAVHPPDRPSYASLFFGEWTMLRAIARLQRSDVAAVPLYAEAVALITERAVLMRRIAYLQKTKRLFDAWHVFHMPLVYIMFIIVLMHVGITLYMGYVPFRS